MTNKRFYEYLDELGIDEEEFNYAKSKGLEIEKVDCFIRIYDGSIYAETTDFTKSETNYYMDDGGLICMDAIRKIGEFCAWVRKKRKEKEDGCKV